MIREIWPGNRDLADADLERLYSYPADPKWLAVNFVSSADGGVTVEGRSATLSTPADRIVYRLGNDLADVVLVGAGTALIEGFEGGQPDQQAAERRRRHGLDPIAPVAVVTSGRSLPPDAPVITKASVPTIVITSAAAPADLRAAWSAAGADVMVAGTDTVDFRAAVDGLVARGLPRIDCEGGPHLFASLAAAGAVDELRLTIAPLLIAGTASRIATGAGLDPARLELASVLVEDGTLLLRYLL
ncbi:pyrimidine reductase family protein [Amycolatopsis saalfeldensis]|uniref:Pyrimidine reductase, riboflavin biosynthesis n=1 Tax=Amycolatopsis saalfeldensis TaxID=394193 RepID=A0A1H8Q934_9PSEU|nr:pyrimidine reductase family protein [Amycolatopsis saalfeldensis]SEO50720.1 Pyrimidine reductase, riboflavin biosynthesis [Amycolatopsis saalfeldensis]